MNLEANGMSIIDEIDRLLVAYDKAKEYMTKILMGIDQQVDLWQSRRAIIVDQIKSSSMDFLFPKTQRINELAIDTVQNLCRADLLMEQILRIDPKSIQTRPLTTSFHSRSIDRIASPASVNATLPTSRQPVLSGSISNKYQLQPQMEANFSSRNFGSSTVPVPVIRRPVPSSQISSTTASGRLSTMTIPDNNSFKPIEQEQPLIYVDPAPKPVLFQPKLNVSPMMDQLNRTSMATRPHETRTPQSEYRNSPATVASTNSMLSRYQPSPAQGKVRVKLQRIPPGTRWRQARIDVIDSLSAFYVENRDPKVYQKFENMLNQLHDHYHQLEQTRKLVPLQKVEIGDFGVAKYDADGRWYRARLLTNEENNCIRIVYFDFGNIETKLIDQFFPLDRAFTELPAQAIGCTLSQAFPRNQNDQDSMWSPETIDIFRAEVTEKDVEVFFVDPTEEGTEKWPLHFVTVTVGNQTVTNLLTLKQRIEPRPNSFIADQLSTALSHQEYILFNAPIFPEDLETN